MGMEGAPQIPIDDSERIDDVAKAQEMAKAGDQLRTEVSGRSFENNDQLARPGLREQASEARKSAEELSNDPEKAWETRNNSDSIYTREYVADQLDNRVEGVEQLAERQEEIAGIMYDLQNQETLYNLKLDDIKQIKEIIDRTKK